MKKTKLSVAIGLLATASFYTASSMAADSASDDGLLSGWSQGASVALTTEYVWRGISQTNNDPAIQGQFDLTHDSGVYLGVWASNVEYGDGKNSAEIDAWIGFTNEIDLGGIGLTYDIGFLHYEFPAVSAYNIDEIYFGLGISPLEDLNFSAYYYHDLGIENKYANYYLDLNVDYTLPDSLGGITLLIHGGHYDRQAGATDYWDWKAGVAKDIGGFNFEVAYIDTSEYPHSNLSDSRVVATVSRELGGSSAASQDMLPDGFSTSASVALTTDYVWRGISQTMNDPAIQGQFDIAHDSGLYVGTWASNVEYGGTESIEIDAYVGFTNEIDLGGTGLTYDVGFLHYQFPSNSSANIDEIYFGVGIAPIENLDLGVYYYHDIGLENKYANYYVDMSADYGLGAIAWDTTIVTHLGHYDRQAGSSDYWDWKIGVAKDFGDFNFEVAYMDTDDGDSGDDADARAVATVSASF